MGGTCTYRDRPHSSLDRDTLTRTIFCLRRRVDASRRVAGLARTQRCCPSELLSTCPARARPPLRAPEAFATLAHYTACSRRVAHLPWVLQQAGCDHVCPRRVRYVPDWLQRCLGRLLCGAWVHGGHGDCWCWRPRRVGHVRHAAGRVHGRLRRYGRDNRHCGGGSHRRRRWSCSRCRSCRRRRGRGLWRGRLCHCGRCWDVCSESPLWRGGCCDECYRRCCLSEHRRRCSYECSHRSRRHELRSGCVRRSRRRCVLRGAARRNGSRCLRLFEAQVRFGGKSRRAGAAAATRRAARRPAVGGMPAQRLGLKDQSIYTMYTC